MGIPEVNVELLKLAVAKPMNNFALQMLLKFSSTDCFISFCSTSPLESLFIMTLLCHTIPLKEYVLDR
jgi:hypothetical protein